MIERANLVIAGHFVHFDFHAPQPGVRGISDLPVNAPLASAHENTFAIVASGLWVAGMPGPISSDGGVRSDLDWSLLFIVFGLAYIALNVVAILGVVWRKIRPSAHAVTCSEPT